METNLFKGAKFGDKYTLKAPVEYTNMEPYAIYICQSRSFPNCPRLNRYKLAIFSDDGLRWFDDYKSDGTLNMAMNVDGYLNIISRYKDE